MNSTPAQVDLRGVFLFLDERPYAPGRHWELYCNGT